MDRHLGVDRIETAPMLGIWRTLSPTVTKIIRCQPSLACRLSLAPQAAIHSIAAFLNLHVSDTMDVDLLAHEISTRDARELLAEAVPNVHLRLYGLLPRLGSTTRSLSFYRDLNSELGQAAAAILFEAPSTPNATIPKSMQGTPGASAAVQTSVSWLTNFVE